jgi:SAM-dependent methyltransferase
MPELFICPSCRGALAREPNSLRCACATYPVVEGIPIFAPWAKNRAFTLEEVLARHLPPAEGFAAKVLRRLAPGRGRILSAVADREATFLDLAAALGRSGDLDYFRYRFSDLSYIASAALLTPLSKGPVLDLGCGAGHLLRALAARIPEGLIAGLDLNFNLLYLARRFLAPRAILVCADASLPLPFVDGAFEAAVSADVFQYLPNLDRTAGELLRVTQGPLLLSHLWTPSSESPGGFPPERYLELFASRKARLHDDRRLLETFFRSRSLDLSPSGIPHGEALSMTTDLEEKIYTGADYFVSGSVLNPIYEIREEVEAFLLHRRFISDRYTEAYRKHEEFFPESLRVTREQIASGDPELVRKFVLLDLPPNYC